MPKKIKPSDTPLKSEQYFVQEIDGEYQLVREKDMQGIFVNHQAIIILELCDGTRTVTKIKNLLKEAYPDAAEDISTDVNDSLSILLGHGAVSLVTKKSARG